MEGQVLKETTEKDARVKRRGSVEREEKTVKRCGGVWEDKFNGGSEKENSDARVDKEEEEEEEEWQQMQHKRKKRKTKKQQQKKKKKQQQQQQEQQPGKHKQKDGIANGKNSFRRLRSKLRANKKEKKEEELFTARMVEEERQLLFQVGSGLPPVKEVLVVPREREGTGARINIKTPPPEEKLEEEVEEATKDSTVKTSWTLHPFQVPGVREGEADPDSSDYVDAAEVRRALSGG
ncbi:hypothetical protein E2C01_087484 [Portunus trituberculatus]|uniref:Uncharacterized protein n=1 Tax=Portunus trituberculatus TaxID=210409 RepID=A0A5B7JE56_PORTR|nr:hypothetical protein [Portunus trituberculatus]